MHIETDTLILFLDDKLSSNKRAEVQTHLAVCAQCTEELADIYKLQNSLKYIHAPIIDKDMKTKVENIVKNNSETNNRKSNKTSLKLALTGAFTVLIITLYVFVFNNNTIKYREINKVENAIIIEPQNEALLTPNELNFKWEKIKNSAAYHFILFKENGKLFWENIYKANSLTLPSSLKMEIGKKYLWRVEIIFPDNSKKRSKLYVFTYKKQ